LSQAQVFPRPIVTRVDGLTGFYPAEDYHQDFLAHHPNYPYIVYNDLPKIENFKRLFPAYYVGQPVLVSNVLAP
jgi:peptide-methionine (S)-S-oxide reductase